MMKNVQAAPECVPRRPLRNRWKRLLRVLAGPAFFLPLCVEAENGSALAGVWQGTLGNQDIIVCFNGDGGETDVDSGSYYYLRHLTPLRLQPEKIGNGWYESLEVKGEETKTGTWSLQVAGGGKLTGLWRSGDGARSRPLALTLMSGEREERACGSDAYNDRLEALPPVIAGNREHFQEKPFRRLRRGGEETVELLLDGPGIGRINAALRATLPQTKVAMGNYFSTRREFLGSMGLPVEDETHADPTYWSTEYVSVKNYRWATGSGAKGLSFAFRTWDARSGEEVDPWTWLVPSREQKTVGKGRLPGKLKAFRSRSYQPDPACVADDDGQYFLTVETTGLRFWQMPRGDGCADDFLVLYAEIVPFLTEQGRVAVARIARAP